MRNILYIVWNESNNVGISIIDEQHRGIISTINSLYHFIQRGQGEDILRSIMVMLVQYTNIHFNTEETLMEESGYPEIEGHRELHQSLYDKTKAMSFDAGRNTDPEKVLRFLKEWWLGHINKEDKKYVPYLKKLIYTKRS
jgi:hemerythrin-like metal-binding protein